MPSRLASLLFLLPCLASAQQAHRPPAVPLIVNDPSFSVWSMADRLNETPTKHWSEAQQPLTGLIRVDDKTYQWMGGPIRGFGLPKTELMLQQSVAVTPLHTVYTFAAGGVTLRVTFFTPLLPRDLDVMSRPVTYLTWDCASTDGVSHRVDLVPDADPALAVNDAAEQVTWSRSHVHGLNVLSIGTRDQAVLNRSGDRIRADWGYFRLAVSDALPATLAATPSALADFVRNGKLTDQDDLDGPRPAGGTAARAAHLALQLPFGQVTSTLVRRHVLLAFTQQFSIEYLGTRLHDYWQRNGMSVADLLAQSEKDYEPLEARGAAFDRELTAAMRGVGGDDYAYLTSLLFRQTIAAHKLVADQDGHPLFFSKENDSNGCIDTVDVTYPSSPFFLFFNPELLKAQLEPVMHYASLPRWRFPFAPHDLGTFPLADGQVYGGGERNEDDQMPVEESGNLLIMVAALARAEHNFGFARRYMPQLTLWAGYLAEKGLDPENQLSTDDFAGHLAHNTNLSLKAIEALGSFVQIADGVGDAKLAAHYRSVLKDMPARWQRMALDGDHYKLAFDQPGTWSQKYNLVWDNLLDLHLFPPDLARKEWAFYKTHLQPFGLPLDNRKTITKLDWEVWTATLAPDPADYADLVHRLVVWADNTASRVPTTDFYDAVSGRQQGFQARSVVGGIFIKALSDRTLARRWQLGEAETTPTTPANNNNP